MNLEQIQIIAGSLAGFIFAAGSINMLIKAWRTKDLSSYSAGQLILNNVGNLIYWLYVISLPFGPIWLMHGFFTITTVIMLVWYIIYRIPPESVEYITSAMKRVALEVHGNSREMMEFPIIEGIPDQGK